MSLQQQFGGISLQQFLYEISDPDYFWIVKRLSGNDTGMTGGHQSGLYLTRAFCEKIFPSICTAKKENPDAFAQGFIASDNHPCEELRAIYYNSKVAKNQSGGRNEYRLTRWGGSSSPVQNHDNTGTVIIIAGRRDKGKSSILCWVARDEGDEDAIEGWLGEEVEPGKTYDRNILPDEPAPAFPFEIPDSWLTEFPPGNDIFNLVASVYPHNTWTRGIDSLLLKRRELEFKIFQYLEFQTLTPVIHRGFETVEDFLVCANKITNRRKSRSGSSLERNLERIFSDSALLFETQVVTEHRVKVDFLFPSKKRYVSAGLCDDHLHMLAAKTCCKDRWRQVLSEAQKIPEKHLFTLQQGISENQLREMFGNNIKLVIPEPNKKYFPENFRPELLTLKSFVEFITDGQKNMK